MLYESVQQPPEIVTLTKRKTEKAEVLVSCLSSYVKVTKTQNFSSNSAMIWRQMRTNSMILSLACEFCSFMLETKKRNIRSLPPHKTKLEIDKKEKNTIIPTSKNNITLVRARHSPQLYDLPSNYFLWYEFIHWSHSKNSILFYSFLEMRNGPNHLSVPMPEWYTQAHWDLNR